MAEKIKQFCEICKREVEKDHIAWKGSFVICDKCQKYLRRKSKEGTI